jgi:hypothetical protein
MDKPLWDIAEVSAAAGECGRFEAERWTQADEKAKAVISDISVAAFLKGYKAGWVAALERPAPDAGSDQ